MGNHPSTTNMKFMALLASAAAASAQLVSYPNGAVAPAKTPEVVAAEAAHFAAKGLPAWGAYPYGTYGWNGYAGAYAGATDGLDTTTTDMLDTHTPPMEDTHTPQL